MFPKILHIYGPLWVNSYGFMMAIGILVAGTLAFHTQRRRQLISEQLFMNMISCAIVSGLCGSRLFVVVTEWDTFQGQWWEVFYPWIGGLSILGTIMGVIVGIIGYCFFYKIPLLRLFDLMALYAPLMGWLNRIGCFLAGCCYGIHAEGLRWAVTYTNPECMAPLHIPLHPTQLYLSLVELCIFVLLYWGVQRITSRPGNIFFAFLFFESLERGVIDLWRGDATAAWQNIHIGGWHPTLAQVTAAGLGLVAILGFIYVNWLDRLKTP